LPLKNSLDQAIDTYHNTIKKAMRSRDKNLVREINNLEKEYEKKRAKLEREAEKTMDPGLRREWKKAQNEYSDFTYKILLELDAE
jgi:hypothetical protein